MGTLPRAYHLTAPAIHCTERSECVGVVIASTETGAWVCFHKYQAQLIHAVLRDYDEDCFDEFLDDLDLLDAREWAAAARLVEKAE